MIPRLSDTDRDGNLADNDILTVPPFGVVNTAITPGLLIFNSDANAFQFWDGELWRQLFYNTTTLMGNEGVVKVNSGGIDQELPKYNLTHSGNSYGTAQEVIYELPLNYASSPTTSWPENIVSPADSDIYVNTTSGYKWIENPILGQVHVWRLILNVDSRSNSSGSLLARLRNIDSNFEVNSIQLLPQGSSAGNILTFYFYTIADEASVGANKGYKLYLQADATCTATVHSFTRISNFKD